MPSSTNRILKNQYRIDRFVGQGPTGFVYRGFDLINGRNIAIKKLRVSSAQNLAAFERLLTPARNAGNHQIAPLPELYASFENDDRFYIVSEWVEGKPLKSFGTASELTGKRKLDLIALCLDALGQLHKHGIVHGNLKPSNILIPENQPPIFSDLGIELERESSVLNPLIDYFGARKYQAPERLAHGHADMRADVYAMGVVALELVEPSAGQNKTPFSALTVTDALQMPDATLQVLRCAAEPDPKARFSDALDFQNAFLARPEPARKPYQIKPSNPPLPPFTANSSPSPVHISSLGASSIAPFPPATESSEPIVIQPSEQNRLDVRRISTPSLILLILGLFALGAVSVFVLTNIFTSLSSKSPFANNANSIPAESARSQQSVPLAASPTKTLSLPFTQTPAIATPFPNLTLGETTATELPLPVATESFFDLGQLTPVPLKSQCTFGEQDGLYTVRSRADRIVCTAVFPQTYSNFRINARFKMLQGDGIGSGNTMLVFGYESPRDYFGISFTRVGRLYGVTKWKNNVPQSILFYNWSESLARPDEKGITTNQVSLEIKDKQLTLWANGSLIGNFPLQDFGYQGGQVGFSVYTSDLSAITHGGASGLEHISIEPIP